MVDDIEQELEGEGLLEHAPVKKSSRKIIIVILIIVLLFIGAGYFGYRSMKNSNKEDKIEALAIGVQYGYKSGLIEIFNKAITCEPVQITNEGVTVNLLDTKCLSVRS